MHACTDRIVRVSPSAVERVRSITRTVLCIHTGYGVGV
jgi:hypothetical protein